MLGAAAARTSLLTTGFNCLAGSGAGAAVAAGAAAVVEDELEAAVVEDELEAAVVEAEDEAAAFEASSSPLLHAAISITAMGPNKIVTVPPRSDRTIMTPPPHN